MTFEQLEYCFPALCRSGMSYELRSDPGIGKSSVLAQQVIRMSNLTGEEWGLSICFPPNMSPTDAMGFMVPINDGKGNLISTYTRPLWFQALDPITHLPNGKLVTDYKYGLQIIDEYGQGEADVKRCMTEMFLNKRVGPHLHNPGWSIFAASNYPTSRSGVTKDFDHGINRRTQLDMKADVKGWVKWADAHDINYVFKTFAEQFSQVVFHNSKPDVQGPFCTPRSLVHLSKIFTELADKDGNLPTDSVAVEIANGTIGVAATGQLIDMIKMGQDLPSYLDIVRDPGGTKVPTNPGAIMLICYHLAERATDKDIDPIVTYMQRLPKDFAFTFFKAAVRRDVNLLNNEAMGTWCASNATLMAVVQSVRELKSPIPLKK